MIRGTPLLLLLLVGCTGATVAPATIPETRPSPPRSPLATAPEPAPTPPASAPKAPEITPEAISMSIACTAPSPKGKGVSPEKRQMVELLLKGQSVLIVLDARRAGVVVPAHVAMKRNLVVEVGYSMATPITDLKVDARGISGTLSFKRTPFFTEVPWSAVYVTVGSQTEKGWQWDEDVPVDQRCPSEGG